jgi:hypothetical protein
MNLGKIVLQVGCSDKIIQPISSTFILHSCIIKPLNKNICVRKQNDNVMRLGRVRIRLLAFENVCKNFV